ncbi:MAG: hypothetical protein GC139_00730 [Sideroxydans sp.]|nr:hypothetical protein [Sideroxydans sp.]
MRVKSQWFKSGKARTPEENASAVAFIVWRIGENALRSMRNADFEIAVGAQYFSFLSEFLIFLVQVADRIAYRRMSGEARVAFTSMLANRVGENLSDNWSRLLGGMAGEHKAAFIERLNQRAGEYAEFEYGENEENFSFMRHLGYVMEEVMDERDRYWVTDQLMAIEAPEAVETLEKAMRGLFDNAPSSRRRSSGVGAD